MIVWVENFWKLNQALQCHLVGYYVVNPSQLCCIVYSIYILKNTIENSDNKSGADYYTSEFAKTGSVAANCVISDSEVWFLKSCSEGLGQNLLQKKQEKSVRLRVHHLQQKKKQTRQSDRGIAEVPKSLAKMDP